MYVWTGPADENFSAGQLLSAIGSVFGAKVKGTKATKKDPAWLREQIESFTDVLRNSNKK
jgi:hypothetical protein